MTNSFRTTHNDMEPLEQLFASVAVVAEFHPKLKAIRFWQDSETLQYHSKGIFYDVALAPREELEADIAHIATQLSAAVWPNYHAFCIGLEQLFNGAHPSGPIAQLEELDWHIFRKISSYAQYWKHRNPREVNKLITFVMALPVFSRFAGQLIIQQQSTTERQILDHIAQKTSFIMGKRQFKQLFRQELDMAYHEAKMLVSTFRNTKTDDAAAKVNGLLSAMMTKMS